MSRVKSPPSTSQRLGLFREECRKYYAHLRKPEETKSRTEPDPKQFGGHAGVMALQIKADEKSKHEVILRGPTSV